jgi:hypothetical protein
MAQIQKGTTFATGDQVTATTLNAHVDNAVLLPGAISDQVSDTAALTDTILINKAGSLKKTTVSSALDAGGFLKADGTIPLTTGAQLVLGSTQQLSALQATSKGYVDATYVALVPTGAIIAFYRSTTPTGWLECNGATILNSGDTIALYALIGATLPDLRGEFVRGWDNGKGTDPTRALGTSQTDMFQGHYHQISPTGYSLGGSGVGLTNNSGGNGSVASTIQSDGTNGTPRFGPETRPRNVAFMYCIKK